MVRCGNVEVNVCIAGVKVQEFVHDGNHYVECDLQHVSSYKIPLTEGGNSTDVAMWPVTPYTVHVRNLDTSGGAQTGVWATLFVDGCKISRHLVKSSSTKMIEGIDDGSSVKEFLFSFPRLVESEKDRMTQERLSNVGTIRLEIQSSRYLESEVRESRGVEFKASSFQQANKKDAKHAPTNATTRMGNVVSSSSRGHGGGGMRKHGEAPPCAFKCARLA